MMMVRFQPKKIWMMRRCFGPTKRDLNDGSNQDHKEAPPGRKMLWRPFDRSHRNWIRPPLPAWSRDAYRGYRLGLCATQGSWLSDSHKYIYIFSWQTNLQTYRHTYIHIYIYIHVLYLISQYILHLMAYPHHPSTLPTFRQDPRQESWSQEPLRWSTRCQRGSAEGRGGGILVGRWVLVMIISWWYHGDIMLGWCVKDMCRMIGCIIPNIYIYIYIYIHIYIYIYIYIGQYDDSRVYTMIV